MSRVICITGWFEKFDKAGHPTGELEFLVSHGIDEDTGKSVTLPCCDPRWLGAKIDPDINEYVIE